MIFGGRNESRWSEPRFLTLIFLPQKTECNPGTMLVVGIQLAHIYSYSDGTNHVYMYVQIMLLIGYLFLRSTTILDEVEEVAFSCASMTYRKPLTQWNTRRCWKGYLRWGWPGRHGGSWEAGTRVHSARSNAMVKQGSVLSPSLFLLVMDPLLKQLETSGLGLFVNSFYVGGFLHADDIRTLATSADSLKAQVSLVKSFSEENFLKLNVQKRVCSIEGGSMAISQSVRLMALPCLSVVKGSV